MTDVHHKDACRSACWIKSSPWKAFAASGVRLFKGQPSRAVREICQTENLACGFYTHPLLAMLGKGQFKLDRLIGHFRPYTPPLAAMENDKAELRDGS